MVLLCAHDDSSNGYNQYSYEGLEYAFVHGASCAHEGRFSISLYKTRKKDILNI